MYIEEFTPGFYYKKGLDNKVADRLSQHPMEIFHEIPGPNNNKLTEEYLLFVNDPILGRIV